MNGEIPGLEKSDTDSDVEASDNGVGDDDGDAEMEEAVDMIINP